MLLADAFGELMDARVNLDKSRRERILSAHHALRTLLEADPAIRPYLVTTFLQGSQALGTAVKPEAGGSYDVDVVLALLLLDANGRRFDFTQIVGWLHKRLLTYERYRDHLEVKNRCVRVHYADDGYRFHVDVVPAHADTGPQGPILLMPDARCSHPRGFLAWLNAQQEARYERLKWLVRLFKYWRNLHGLDVHSMLLTTLVGQCIPAGKPYRSLDEAFVRTLEALLHWSAGHATSPSVCNPSLPSEDLAHRWTTAQFIAFRDAIASAAATARQALDAMDEAESIRLWNRAELLCGTLPTRVRGLDTPYRERATAYAAGRLGVSASGAVSAASGARVPRTGGFYGPKL